MNKKSQKGYGFGTFQGVFTPSILTILGVVMYLRFGWVLGNLGLVQTLLIVTVSCGITFLTALSISQLATNMRVGGGGAYYIISRSLGLEAGAAIGLPLFCAQALGIAFYVAGFTESIVSLAPDISPVLIGIGTLVILTVLAYFSADLALKFQFIILALILTSLASFFLGSNSSVASSTVSTLVVPTKQSFWFVFAVFFPAVTGIEAGLSMSGDLKSPEKSLPRGTFAAIGVSYLVYLAIPIFLSNLGVSQQSLLTESLIMRSVARWGDLILYGLWGASLSSALGALLGAPRTLQALAQDGVVPKWIGKGFGKKNDPRLATAISFCVALLGILLGNLNAIASILSMFFLISYGLLNLSAAFEGIIDNPSWRPKFRVHWLWSLAGAFACLFAMLMINAGATIVAAIVAVLVYWIMQRRRINAYWGDMRYGILMLFMRFGLYKLALKKPTEKTWRPNILVLSGSPNTRWYLIALADAISQGKGFLTVAAILSDKVNDSERIENMETSIHKYLQGRSVPALVKVFTSDDIVDGAQSLIKSYGFGPLEPNTILLGDVEKVENFKQYASLLLTAYQNRKNIIIVREDQEVSLPQKESPKVVLWWRRLGNNTGLMLALAYLLKTSPEWQGAKLVIKTIVETEVEKEEQTKHFKKFIQYENLEAEIEIHVRNQEYAFDLIREHSQDASLVFLGMREPEDGESKESYSHYYEQLLNGASNMPTTAFVLASEEINFEGIFTLRERF